MWTGRSYGVAMASRIDKIIGLFCRIFTVSYGSFAKETYNFIDSTNQSHPRGDTSRHIVTLHQDSTCRKYISMHSNSRSSRASPLLVGLFCKWYGSFARKTWNNMESSLQIVACVCASVCVMTRVRGSKTTKNQVHMYISVCINVRICVRVSVCVRSWVWVRLCVFASVRLCVCVSACLRDCVAMCLCVCASVRLCVSVSVRHVSEHLCVTSWDLKLTSSMLLTV